jgi:hypothetical protein
MSFRTALIVFLKGVGETLAVIATFLPIKAVLIAADQRIPGFVPGWLADQGSTIVAFVLGLSALAAGLARVLALRAISWIELAFEEGITNSKFGSARYLTIATVSEFTSRTSLYVLVAVFVLAVAVLSWVIFGMLLFVALVILAYGWLLSKARNTVVARRREFASRVAGAIQNGSTWIAVGVGMPAAIFQGESLGVTELLLSIVLTRQVLTLVPSILVSGLGEPVGSSARGLSGANSENVAPRRAGVDKALDLVTSSLATGKGRRSLLGLEQVSLTEYSPIVSRNTVTLIGVAHEASHLVVARTFHPQHRQLMLKELALLSEISPLDNSNAYAVALFHHGGLVGYRRTFHLPPSPSTLEQLDAVSTEVWQAKFESWSISHDSQLLLSARMNLTTLPDLVEERLQFAETLPGPHQSCFRSLLLVWGQVEIIWNTGPLVFGFSGPVNARRVLSTGDEVTLIDPSDWAIRPLGADWPRSRNYPKILAQHLDPKLVNSVNIGDALIRRNLSGLNTSLKRMDLYRSQILSEQILQLLEGGSTAIGRETLSEEPGDVEEEEKPSDI